MTSLLEQSVAEPTKKKFRKIILENKLFQNCSNQKVLQMQVSLLIFLTEKKNIWVIFYIENWLMLFFNYIKCLAKKMCTAGFSTMCYKKEVTLAYVLRLRWLNSSQAFKKVQDSRANSSTTLFWIGIGRNKDVFLM